MSDAAHALKNRYFDRRNAQLRQSAGPDRAAQGEREWRTLETLTRLSGYGEVMQPSTGRVVDAGCGDRYLESGAVARGFAYQGYDIDTLNFESDAFPLEAQSLDLFVSLAVIEHLRDPGLFLSEALRLLRPGGAVVISTPNFQQDFRNFYNDPTHVKPYTPHSLALVLKLAGFADVQVYPGLRCKPDWYYQGNNRFWKARYLLPFRGDNRLAPDWLKGRATSMFAIGRKPL